MVGDEYSVCPMCGGNDGQGCYEDCPSNMRLDINRLRKALQSIAATSGDESAVIIAKEALKKNET